MPQSKPDAQQLASHIHFMLSAYQLEMQQTLAELAFCEFGCEPLAQNLRDLILISQESLALWETPTPIDDEPNELNPF